MELRYELAKRQPIDSGVPDREYAVYGRKLTPAVEIVLKLWLLGNELEAYCRIDSDGETLCPHHHPRNGLPEVILKLVRQILAKKKVRKFLKYRPSWVAVKPHLRKPPKSRATQVSGKQPC